MNDRDRIASILEANVHMVISTADGEGRPWVTPVAYTFDSDNTLYWVSAKDARHSVNVRSRKDVAIVIYMTEPTSDALYIEAEAHELEGAVDIEEAIRLINTRSQPDKFRVNEMGDVSGEAPWRIYKAIPTAMYVREQDTINGQVVTRRRQIV